MTHINPALPAVGDTNWGAPLVTALNVIVTQVNTLDDEITSTGAGSVSVVNNGDGTLTLSGAGVSDNGDGTFTITG